MKILPVETETVDMQTGETTKSTTPFQIIPPRATACQVCGHDPAHAPDQPHNAQSLYYQYAFRADHGRWPTWKDAMAHCSNEVQAKWEAELRRRGVWKAVD